MSHNTQNTHDAPEEALTGHYTSTIGWDPNRSKPNEREIARKAKLAKDEYRTREALARAIEVRPARELMRRDPDEDPQPTRPPRALLPPFWYEGQLTALTGPSPVENSLLAVQLAETIAGTRTLLSALPPGSPPYESGAPAVAAASGVDVGGMASEAGASDAGVVLSSQVIKSEPLPTHYFDLARTRRQYREIYTHNGRRYRFSQHLNFGLLAGEPLPDKYKGRREAFYRDAIGVRLAETEGPVVVIIDNISWLLRSGTPTELRRLLKTFRRYVNETGNSMLLLDSSCRSPHDSKGTRHTALAEFADSLFAMYPSTFSPDHRYLKLLSCSAVLPLASANGSRVSSPHVSKGSMEVQNTTEPSSSTMTQGLSIDPVHVYQLTHSASPPSLLTAHSSPPTKASPFPGFQFIGTSAEELHTRDYAAEIAKFEATVLRVRPKKKNVVESSQPKNRLLREL